MRFSHPLIIYNCLRYSSFLFCNCFLDFLYFNPFIFVYIYIFHAFKPHCYFSILYHICFSFDIFDYPIHCHHINHISSLCFSISSSSNTPLLGRGWKDITSYGWAEKKSRCLGQAKPIYLPGSWCCVTWGNNAPGHHRYSFTSAKKIAQTEGHSHSHLSDSEEDVQNSLQDFSHNQSGVICPLCSRLHRIDQTICRLLFL